MSKLIVGNWKMNGVSNDLLEISGIIKCADALANVDCGLCVPTTLLSRAVQLSGAFRFGGQDCHHNVNGAHTGCVSAEMLVDAGASMVILGHSERRADCYETNEDVCAKSIAATRAGLHSIICVGESGEQRDAGDAIRVVLEQLVSSLPNTATAQSVGVAYEPIWAIGTGRIPSTNDVYEMHTAIRRSLQERFSDDGLQMRILYGGSMNGDNAASLLAIENVDGGLIGGASLTAAKFQPILAAANAAAQ